MIVEDATREQLLDEVANLRRRLKWVEAGCSCLSEPLAATDVRPRAFSETGLNGGARKKNQNGAAKTSPEPRDLALSLLDKFPGLIWRSGVDAKCNYFNETWLEFTGRTLEQELGTGWVEGVHPEDMEDCLRSYQAAFDARKPFILEYRLRHHDGQYRWIVDHARPFTDLQGGFAGYIGSCYDITRRKQAEQALARSEGQLKEAQEIAHLGSWNWDIVSNTITWSDEHYRIFGFKPQEIEMTYERCLSRVHPDDQHLVRARVEQAFRDRQPYECYMRVRREDGTVRVVHSCGQVVFDEESRPVRMFGTTQDITDRWNTEESLGESQRRFKAVFENSLDAILLINDEGHYLDGNPALCQLLGFSREELPGLTLWDVTHGENRSKVPEALCRFLDAGTIGGEYSLLCKGGAIREVEFRAVANILPGVHLAVLRDVTERNRAARELHESHALVHAVIEGIPDAVYIKDLQGRYVLLNSSGARLIARTVEEVLGGDDYTVFEAENARQFMAEDRRIMESGESLTVEHTATAAGITRTYLSTKAPFRGPRGEVLGVLGISIDITEQKQRDEQLRGYCERVQALSRQLLTTQEKERRHLARELHDEFGQLLATLNFQIHAAKSLGRDALARLDACAALLQQAGEKIRHLTQDLHPTMLGALGLEAALRLLVDRHCGQTICGVQFRWHLAEAQLSPDLAVACYRVVQEALTNVMRHARARNVWIELRQTEGVLELSVRDDGVGFDLLPTERRAARRGSLGLVGIGERVSILGGCLNIQSTPGLGTRICATIPWAPDLVQSAGP